MLNYQNRQGNPVTFETLAEVCAHAPEATAGLSGNAKMPRIVSPSLIELVPKDLMYVYRSENLYGGETAARNNTCFIVFAEKRFEEKAEALSWLRELGMAALADESIGSILLVMPEKDCGYTESDLQNIYVLMNAFLTLKSGFPIPGLDGIPSESEYCGGYGKNYFFGAGKAADFMYNFMAGSRDELIGRAAGFFAFGGGMAETAAVNGVVPAFLVNPPAAAVHKLRAANGCNAYAEKDGISVFYNQDVPFREIRIAHDPDGEPGPWMVRAYKEMFMFLQRTANVSTKYLEPAITNPYQGYVAAPPITRFALAGRNPIINYRTVIGDLQVTLVHDSEAFSDLKVTEKNLEGIYKDFLTDENDYLDAWYEILPQGVLHNTAPEHSVPLLMANHGGGDDPLMYVDETGILLTAGEQQFAIAAGMHSGLTFVGGELLVGEALSALAKYMLEKYPALDPERIYVTGYSMGGAATYSCIAAHPEVFAAAVPMAMPLFHVPEGTAEKYEKYDMPIKLISSTYDFAGWNPKENHLSDGAQLLFKAYGAFNGLKVPEDFDFVKYPFLGQPADSMEICVKNGEWRNFDWLLQGPKGWPIMGLNVTEYLQHSLWPGYGDIAWDFFRHYRRDAETGEIVYTE